MTVSKVPEDLISVLLSAPAFFLGTINLFPEDFVHAPEFAVRNTETTVGMRSVAI